jgi:hypothetical protein
MSFTAIRVGACAAILCAACFISLGRVSAQAPPGPLPPSHPLPPPPPARPAKKKPEMPARATLAGFWKLNADQSDDPTRKFEDARKTQAGQGGPGSGSGGGMGGPRVGIGGYPYPGGGPNGPYGGGGPRMGDPDAGTNEQLQELVRPAFSQDISLKDAEVDAADEHSNRVVFYTDGRKLQKSKDKDDSLQEVSARWNGPQLVTDEKGPRNKKMSRTLELSPDGKQMYVTWHVEGRRSDSPVIIRYVYDAATEYE